MALFTNPWLVLAFAIVLEVAGTMALKLSDGFARWYLGLLAIGLYAICFWALANVLRFLPVGVVYAIWAGAGIVAIALVGYLAFGERLGALQLVSMALIVAGVIGLRLTTA